MHSCCISGLLAFGLELHHQLSWAPNWPTHPAHPELASLHDHLGQVLRTHYRSQFHIYVHVVLFLWRALMQLTRFPVTFSNVISHSVLMLTHCVKNKKSDITLLVHSTQYIIRRHSVFVWESTLMNV